VKALNELAGAVLILIGFLFVIITLEGSTRDTAVMLTVIAMVAHIVSIFTGDSE
jgi:hypothetical protein